MAMTSLSRWATRAAASLPSTHTQPSVVAIAASRAASRRYRPQDPPNGGRSQGPPGAGPARYRSALVGVVGTEDVAHGQHTDQAAAPHDGQVADSQLQHQVGRVGELAV